MSAHTPTDFSAVTGPSNIVIVGGGAAGWMAAAALSKVLNSAPANITLIESEEIGIVGVGEASIPDIINFNRMLGISETEFLRATSGTFKLGIEFNDWGKIGDSYFHPFGSFGVDMNGFDFHQYWLHARRHGNDALIQDYSLCSLAAKDQKFTTPSNDPRSVLSHLKYAYHFDAAGYAKFLRAYAEKRGVRRIEGKVRDIKSCEDSGHIERLTMENGTVVDGDFFIDCSGFRALLLGQTLGVDYRDWSHWLPCDRAQAVACERSGPLLPYTRATAQKAGWQWRIPVQHRTGNGHIYSSQFVSDDEAADTLLNNLDGNAMGSPRLIKFKTGHRNEFWTKNCVALGLSAGFLEPLESTSLYLIQMGISRLIALFPSAQDYHHARAEYNRQMQQQFEQVRDFIILHYAVTERNDSEFWNYCRTMKLPDSLTRKIDLFESAGRVFRYDEELFSKDSWIAVMIGQNIYPKHVDPIVSTVTPKNLARSLSSMAASMRNAVANMPSHEDYLTQHMARHS